MNWSLYLVTDRALSGERSLETVVEQAVSGGVTVVQLREKNCEPSEFLAMAHKLKTLLHPHHIPLIINDDVDIAIEVQAEGIHIGQSDRNVKEVREILGAQAIIGLSVETKNQAIEANELPIDYIGISPVFATQTKANHSKPWGLEGVRWLREHSRHPLIAIGGINTGNASDVIRAGAHGIAVVSSICSAKDPEAAARELRILVDKAMAANRNPRGDLLSFELYS